MTDFFERYKKIKSVKIKSKKLEKPKVVVAGRSNVGKSTFVRHITGKNVRVGKRPGVTLKINEYDMGNYILVDMPGFGFMHGIDKKVQEKIKDEIVHYIEGKRDEIATAIQIIDAKSFLEIVERWDQRGEIPIDIEMFDFLNELELNPILVVNKMDKIKKTQWDEHLNKIVETLGYKPPWSQWEFVVPAILKEKKGLDEIKHKIIERVNKFKSQKTVDIDI
ncbi:GTP-binding protein EngB [Methanotorris igneus]|uniref:Probable GTP-binding protein EngB n=1 Tax=Methanotorris igneus (strain DSM 5666 / JCM 11834 / Kol 5) TaxID=880724 RepID=F6BBX3_METIK|nr:GTP-binding protein EngB [Methanotorris igneus]AEF97253.1 GTP-binding protein engB [Methanotorris igneus Kol 5]